MYKPNVQNMASYGRHQHRTDTTVDGFPTTTWVDASVPIIQFDAKPFHGAQLFRTDRPLARDGFTITTWYDPSFKATDRILMSDDSAQAYEVIAAPEDVGRRHQYSILIVERLVDN